MTASVAAPAAANAGAAPRSATGGPRNGAGLIRKADVPSSGRRRWTVPVRLRAAATLVVALMAGLLTALVMGVTDARDNVRNVARVTAPQAATAANLYYSLADMDAQVANILLIGHDEHVGNKQSALRLLRQNRAAVSADIQALIDGGLDRRGREVADTLLGHLAAYDSFTAQARLADDQVLERPVGKPPALAINFYLSATALMHQDMLPAADELGRAAEAGLGGSADEGRDDARLAGYAVVGLGTAALVALLVLQRGLARNFRRILNPALAAVTVAVAVVTGLGASLLLDHGDRVHSAKSESFDTFSQLARTRAVASDANADESRYLILPERARFYRAQFGEKAIALESSSRHPGLGSRLAAFRRDDAALVGAVEAGRTDVAIGMATNVARGNLAFEFFDYQDVLDETADAHHADFTRRVVAAEDDLSGWRLLPPLVLGAGILLVVVGVRPRLREYR